MSRDFCQIDSVEKLGLERGLVYLRAADHPDRVADIRNLFQFLQCVLGKKTGFKSSVNPLQKLISPAEFF